MPKNDRIKSNDFSCVGNKTITHQKRIAKDKQKPEDEDLIEPKLHPKTSTTPFMQLNDEMLITQMQ